MLPPPSQRPRQRPPLTRRLASLSAIAALLVAGAATSARADTSLPAPDPSPIAGPVPPGGGTPTGPVAAAQAQAAATGQDVPVPSLTTQTQTMVAHPDGTLSSTSATQPVRVLKEGTWSPLDANLAADPGGGFSPKATPSTVILSSGGTGPLVTLGDPAGHSMALSLPFALPAPTVTGDTALYPSVLPGVDLSATVTDQGGFSDVLIVHNAAAAANPLLKQLTLAASTTGLTLAATPSGGMTASTTDGTPTYTSPAPVMWDSSTTTDPTTTPSATAAPSNAAPGTGAATTAAPSASAASATPAPSAALHGSSLGAAVPHAADAATPSSVDGPGTGANVVPLPMTTTPNGITLSPSTAVLTSTGTTYPVYLDPYVNPLRSNTVAFDEVYQYPPCSGQPQTNTPQVHSAGNGEGVGYQGDTTSTCGAGYERSYYNVNTTGLDSHMVISKAHFVISSTYAASWDCARQRTITLRTMKTAINGSTDGEHQPAPDTNYAAATTSITSASNPNSNCSDQPADFTVTDQVRQLASGNAVNWTIGLFGTETSSAKDDYVRMSETGQLTTTFDVPPATPTDVDMSPTPTTGAGCGTSVSGWIGATTATGGSSNIQLIARVSSPVSGQLVVAKYTVWDNNLANANGNATTVATPYSNGWRASGTLDQTKIGIVVQDGHWYGWGVQAQDNNAQNLTSPWVTPCHFRYDATPPTQPVITADDPAFPQIGGGEPTGHAGPGAQVSVPVTANDPLPADTCTLGTCSASGIQGFAWKMDTAPTSADHTGIFPVTSTDPDGTGHATVAANVPTWGVHTLYIASVDQAGNYSQIPTSYTFTAPWDANAKHTPGDITGDGTPDLLSTTVSGDLVVIPGNTDPTQKLATGTGQPISPTSYTGPVITSASTQAPNISSDPHDTWNNYLIAHRGSLTSHDVDDLFAFNLRTNTLYASENDLNTTPGTAGFTTHTNLPMPKPSTCTIPDTTRCPSTYQKTWTTAGVSQIAATGSVFNSTLPMSQQPPDLLTVESNGNLWLYEVSPAHFLTDPMLLGDGDWSNLTLITPGNLSATFSTDSVTGHTAESGGTPTLWARDKTTGKVYSFNIKPDNTGLPPLLHAPTSANAPTPIITLPSATYPLIASPGDVNSATNGDPDGNPDLYVTDTSGHLLEYPGGTTNPTTDLATFNPPVNLGTVNDPATHTWNLTGPSGPTATDSTAGLNATLTGGATWYTSSTTPRTGTVLNLDGSTGYATTTGPAVDASKSFTVSAWVKLNSIASNATVVSQSDTAGNANGFQLYLSAGGNAWAFGRHNDDTTGPAFTAAYGEKATTNVWTHLVGVFDATTNKLSLYVNGHLSASTTYTGTTWSSNGPLQIGRRLYEGTYGEYTNGLISGVRTYNTALPPADAANPRGDAMTLTHIS